MTVQIQNPGKSGLIVEFVCSALLSLVRWLWASVPMTGKLGVGCFQRLDSSTVVYIVVVSRLQDVYSAGNPGDLVTGQVGESAMKSGEIGSGAKPGGVGGGGTPQSTVVSTRGTPAAGHPARRGSDPVIAIVRLPDPDLTEANGRHTL